jgi:hypothetical protein
MLREGELSSFAFNIVTQPTHEVLVGSRLSLVSQILLVLSVLLLNQISRGPQALVHSTSEQQYCVRLSMISLRKLLLHFVSPPKVQVVSNSLCRQLHKVIGFVPAMAIVARISCSAPDSTIPSGTLRGRELVH